MLVVTLFLALGPPVVVPAATAPPVASATATEDMERATVQATSATARGLIGRSRALSEALALDLKRLPGDHRDQRFAVLPFESMSEVATAKNLGVVTSDVIATHLARDHHLQLVERAALSRILDEQALSQSGAIDPAQAQQLGNIAGVKALVLGQVSEVPEGFRLAVRVVDAETAAVLSQHDTVLPAEELISYAKDAVVLRSKSGALFRSLVVPGWGQLYGDSPVAAVFFGGTTAALAVSTVATGLSGLYLGYVLYPSLGQRPEDQKTPTAELQATVEQTRTTANVLLSASGVLLLATATAYTATAVHAYVTGPGE